MSINGLSFTSARPTPQPCVSALVTWEIQERSIRNKTQKLEAGILKLRKVVQTSTYHRSIPEVLLVSVHLQCLDKTK